MTRLDRYIFRQLALALLGVTVGLAVLVAIALKSSGLGRVK